jgi:hypothetical protein
MKLRNAVPANHPIGWADVTYEATAHAISFRREMEAIFQKELGLDRAKQMTA